MRTSYGLGVLSAAVLPLVWACSSSSSPVTGGGDDGGGLADTSVDDGSGADGSGHDGASTDASVEATVGGDSGDSGADLDAPADAPVILKNPDAEAGVSGTQCPTGHAWVAGAVQVSDSIARFGGATPTGLNAGWTRTSSDPIVADRATAASNFMTLSVLLPAPPAGNRAALDSTGTLVLSIDSSGLLPQYWQRTDTLSPWQLANAMTTPFDAIVKAVGQASATWSEPAFGASGDRFFYLVTPPAGVPAMHESVWDAAKSQWALGVPLKPAQLASVDATHRRRPTGVSADDLTLFYYDEVAGVQGAAWRTDSAQDFAYFETIAAAPEAAPNLDCSGLYFLSTDADGGTGIAIAQ